MDDHQEDNRKEAISRRRFYLRKLAKAFLILIIIFSFFYFLQPLQRGTYARSFDALFRGEIELARQTFVLAVSQHPFYKPFVKVQDARRSHLAKYRRKIKGDW